MKKKLPPKKGALLNCFFLFSGATFVALWNLILNFSPYFNLIIFEGFSVYMTFTLKIGTVLSFVSSYQLFKQVNSGKVIFCTLMVSCFVLSLFVFLMEVMAASLLKQVCLLLLLFMCGYCMGAFQGEVSGLAASVGSVSITRMQSGIGVSGFGSNLLTALFYFVFPTNRASTRMAAYRNQLIFFVALLVCVVAVYLMVLFVSLKRHPETFYLKGTEDTDSKDQSKDCGHKNSMLTPTNALPLEEIYSLPAVTLRVVDLWVGLVCNLGLSIQTVCFVISNLTAKYDHNNELWLLCYLFVYNVSDTLAKFVPPRFFVSSFKRLHSISLARLALQGYFVLVIEWTPSRILTLPAARMLGFLTLAVIDGFFINNFFCMAADRFRSKDNKHKSGYAMMCALNVGVLAGTFSGVLWTF